MAVSRLGKYENHAAPATLLAIDPGSAGAGNACAAFANGVISWAWFERASRATSGGAVPFATVVVERPAYQGARSDAARVADLIDLAWSGALLAGAYAGRDGARLVEYTPAQWKGSVQKPIHHYRLWQVLTPAERLVLGGADTERRILAAREKGALDRWGKPGAAYYGSSKGATVHNLLDAAALGAYHLGRLTKGGA